MATLSSHISGRQMIEAQLSCRQYGNISGPCPYYSLKPAIQHYIHDSVYLIKSESNQKPRNHQKISNMSECWFNIYYIKILIGLFKIFQNIVIRHTGCSVMMMMMRWHFDNTYLKQNKKAMKTQSTW